MDLKTIIKTEMWKLLHNGKMSACDFADSVGKSSNYIYKICSPTEDVSTPLELFIKMMQYSKNYKPLEKVCAHLGFALVRIPKVPVSRVEENELVSEYQQTLSTTGDAVVRYFRKPTQAGFEAAVEALGRVMRDSASMNRVIEKKHSGQMEIDF